MEHWFDHIMFHSRSRPETPAMVMENRVVTYGMLGAAIERCGHHIAALNLHPDGPVAVLIKNPVRHFTLSLALFRVGIPAISLEHSQADIKALKFSAVLGDSEAGPVIGPGNRVIEVEDSWFSEERNTAEKLPEPFRQPTQVCRWSLTSGTTGVPKAVEQRVADIGRRVLKFVNFDWKIVLSLPGLSSNFGFTNGCAALATGRTLCFAESPFQAVRVIELFSVDLLAASTEQVVALTRAARKMAAHLRSLKSIYLAGSAPSRALLEAAVCYLCNDIHCQYSASEVGQIASASAREILSRPGLAGRLVPGIEVAIFDQHGNSCSAGQIGLVKCRRKGSVPERQTGTASWIELGDLGWRDKDDQLYIAGRVTDVSAIGGRSAQADLISTVSEVEHLFRLEWDSTDAGAIVVGDISEPQIWLGVVDNRGATAQDIAILARRRGMDYPIKLFNLPAIPRGPSGKINRQKLKMLMESMAHSRE